MNRGTGTGAVIVAYYPDCDALNALIVSVCEQVDQLVVVNNGPAESLSIEPMDCLTVQSLPDNVGVAAAINVGVQRLIEAGCAQVLLLDQDSQIPSDLVATLAHHLNAARSEGLRVAAIGPSVRDHNDPSTAPFIRFRLPFNQRLRGQQGRVPCDYVISSGCLINLDCWAGVGPMRDAWFIDNIDLEWCFRARRKGYQVLGSFDTVIDHRIGERERLLGCIPYRRHTPQRLYTMMRNRVFLYRSDASLAFIIHDALRALGKVILFSLIAPRWQHISAMWRGLKAGLMTRPVP
ncbi:MAG: glycosyltransferase family 2 protein [Pseudomonadota bacterium]